VYGEFLRDVIAQAVAVAAERGIAVDFVPHEVVDLDEQDDAITLLTSDGSITADLVILATGRCPDYDIYNLADAPDDRYFPLHIPGTRLDALPLDAECHVLGASLSAYDVVNHLFGSDTGCRFVPDAPDRLRYEPGRNQRSIVLCSRSGRLKKVQSRHPCDATPKHFSLAAVRSLGKGQVTLRQLRDLLQKEAEEHGVAIDWEQLADPYSGCDTAAQLQQRAMEILGGDINAAASAGDSTANFIVDYLNAAEMELWDIFGAQLLSAEQEALFRTQYESAMLGYAAACPVLTAQKILALMEAGCLRIVHGVSSVTQAIDDDGFRIDHRFGTERAAYLVNATGVVDRKVSSGRQPALIANLHRKGILREYQRVAGAANGIDVDMRTLQSAGSDRVLIANMFLWGPGLYVSAAIIMATVVERLLTAAFAAHSR
jgi:uncharacterized NAD(P)/FAD-binding protein YdhS